MHLNTHFARYLNYEGRDVHKNKNTKNSKSNEFLILMAAAIQKKQKRGKIMSNISFDALISVVEAHASTYEGALKDLEDSASASKGTAGSENPGEVSITEATVATTRVQLTQSL